MLRIAAPDRKDRSGYLPEVPDAILDMIKVKEVIPALQAIKKRECPELSDELFVLLVKRGLISVLDEEDFEAQEAELKQSVPTKKRLDSTIKYRDRLIKETEGIRNKLASYVYTLLAPHEDLIENSQRLVRNAKNVQVADDLSKRLDMRRQQQETINKQHAAYVRTPRGYIKLDEDGIRYEWQLERFIAEKSGAGEFTFSTVDEMIKKEIADKLRKLREAPPITVALK